MSALRVVPKKRIEARGVSDFQTIVSQSINANLLQWKGIQATEMLAKSQNARVVIIGAGRGGLPVILNPDKNQHGPVEKEEDR
jgi:hypothetical protein